MDLDDYQQRAHETAAGDDNDIYVLGLIGEAGELATTVKKYKRDDPSEALLRLGLEEAIGDVLWYLAEVATNYDVKLSDAAEYNLIKSAKLFKGSKNQFDVDAPDDQRLPRKFSISFRDVDGRTEIEVDGKPFGDPLTDNASSEDWYRFHDIFHVAYAVHLGWSPVLRKLLGRKRKYDKSIDEVQDGARAVFLEEGISVTIFSQSIPKGSGPSLFANRSNVPFSLVKTVKSMTENVEVSSRDVSAWKNAIAAGFKMFDRLRKTGGGIVDCDLDRKTLKFRALEVAA